MIRIIRLTKYLNIKIMTLVTAPFAMVQVAKNLGNIVIQTVGNAFADHTCLGHQRNHSAGGTRHTAMIGRGLPEAPRPARQHGLNPAGIIKTWAPNQRAITEYPGLLMI